MITLDNAQQAFCSAPAPNIRLLAPAGCGKTAALLHRCLALAERGDKQERFLLLAFTTAARDELESRLQHDAAFEPIRGRAEAWTLNAFGWNRLQDQSQHATLLETDDKRRRAMQNNLQPAWQNDQRIAEAVRNRYGRGAIRLMDTVDALKSLGFDHLSDTTFEKFLVRYTALCEQGLEPYMERQIETLADLEVIDPDRLDRTSDRAARAKLMHTRFFRFWRRAVKALGAQAQFTFEDQKYWFWINYRTPDHKGVERRPIRGAPRFHHVVVDEFQDVDPLDIAMIKAIVERHQASLVVTGDDDQAIYEFRGASPEYILTPATYLDRRFRAMTLAVNYRSPANIVKHSQRLIRRNQRRKNKRITAAPGNPDAVIDLIKTTSVDDCLKMVSAIANEADVDGAVGLISRTRGKLIPYLVYYASEGGPVYTVEELDALGGGAFENLENLLKVWANRHRSTEKSHAIAGAIKVLNVVKNRQLSRADRSALEHHLGTADVDTCATALQAVALYPSKLNKGDPADLSALAMRFINATNVSAALRATADPPGLKGLRFDWEKAADDVWYADPPLVQLADMANSEAMSAEDLISRMQVARSSVVHLRGAVSSVATGTASNERVRPLHLMTAHRAKGKEFDTVVLLDVDNATWPLRRKEDLTERELEAERRLFYVAFTRARKRVVLLKHELAPESQFADELGLPGEWAAPNV